MKILSIITLITVAGIAGCTSNIVKPTEFGGFLTDYNQLTKTTSANGSDTLRWVSATFTANNYSNVQFQPVIFHPSPMISEQVSSSALNDLKAYCTQKITDEAERTGLQTNTPGKGTVSVRMAITGVKVSTEPLQPLEIIPFKLVLAGAGAIIGFRDKNLDIYFEIIGEDKLTQEPLFNIVHKINGEQLDSKWDQMESKHVKKAFDQLSEKSIAALAKHLSL